MAWAISVAGLVVGLISVSWPVLLAATALGCAADLTLGALGTSHLIALRDWRLGSSARALVRDTLLITGLALAIPLAGPFEIGAMVLAVAVIHAARLAYGLVTGFTRQRARARFEWRNIQVDGMTNGPAPYTEPAPRIFRGNGVRAMLATELFFLPGVLVAGLTGWVAAITISALLICASCAAMVVAALLQWRRFASWAAVLAANKRLRHAVAQLQPEVVFYFSSPDMGGYALASWGQTIAAIPQSTLVLLRERVHLDVVGVAVPAVVLPRSTDVAEFQTPSMRVALYATNVTRNNHMVRLRGIRHCFIGHGDSDKVGSYSPLNRMYDEIWVAGRAAVERYRTVSEGVRRDQIRVVGRPQLAEIRRERTSSQGAASLTVLYAPTWEGFFDDSDYSSLLPMGAEIVRALLEFGARVLFKPHPASGHRNPMARVRAKAIAGMLSKPPHRIVPNEPGALYRAFNDADVLVTDVSSLITDFLASRKPYIVTNPRAEDDETFRLGFPATAAAHLIGPSAAGLPSALESITKVDPFERERTLLAEHLLGSVDGDPVGRFLEEITLCIHRADSMRAQHAATADRGRVPE